MGEAAPDGGSTPDAEDAAARTGAGTDEAAELISGHREEIDVLDARILLLIQRRIAASERIQRMRVDSGGRRTHLARENEILDRYRRELGPAGTRLALQLLAFSRGPV